jgi:enamine deaminase RidA (YjgF/YER057c/UK114 family)
MSNLKYFNDEGPGQTHSDLFHFSQAVIVGDTGIVKCSGQGGWDSTGKLDINDMKGQVELAFQNVDTVLQTAGLRGWEDVYLFRTYATNMGPAMEHIVAKLKTRLPNHRPCWTALSVPSLALPEMLIEIEVEAYIPKQ